jgi:hypothetical protein
MRAYLSSFVFRPSSFPPPPMRAQYRAERLRRRFSSFIFHHSKPLPPTKPSFFEPLRAFPAKNHMSRCAPSSVSREFFTTPACKSHHPPYFAVVSRTPPSVFCRSSFACPAPLRKISRKTAHRPAPLRQILEHFNKFSFLISRLHPVTLSAPASVQSVVTSSSSSSSVSSVFSVAHSRRQEGEGQCTARNS